MVNLYPVTDSCASMNEYLRYCGKLPQFVCVNYVNTLFSQKNVIMKGERNSGLSCCDALDLSFLFGNKDVFNLSILIS